MSILLCGSHHIIATSGLQVTVWSKDQSKTIKLDVASSSGASIPKAGSCAEPPRIVDGMFSSDFKFLALADDLKQVTVWDCSSWTLLKNWTLERKASKVAFDGQGNVLVADKSGDVFRLKQSSEDSEEAKPELLLGHLSMLLDVRVTPCGRYIVTCDRDEKIRISHYPNAYNIHGFCLGHTDFITRTLPVSTKNETLLVSASGDGSLKLWDLKTGEELCSRLCHTDAGIDAVECDSDPRENGDGQLRTGQVYVPVVSSVKYFHRETGRLVLVASVEGFQGLLVYSVDLSKHSIELTQKIVSSAPIWDYDLDGNGDLWSVENGQPHLNKRIFDDQHLQFISGSDVQSICEIEESFWEGAKLHPRTDYRHLKKHWFDNVKEYMERKEERLYKKKDKEDQRKKPKLEHAG